MNTQRFADFIAGQSQNNSPEYTSGIINTSGVNSTVKSVIGSELIGKLTFNADSLADQELVLNGGNNFFVTFLLLTNPSTSLDSLDTATVTSITGTFLEGELVRGSVSGSVGTMVNLTGSTMEITNSQSQNLFVITDVLTGETSGATATITAVNHANNYIKTLNMYSGTGLTGFQIMQYNQMNDCSCMNSAIVIQLNGQYGYDLLVPKTTYMSSPQSKGAACTFDIYVYGFAIN